MTKFDQVDSREVTHVCLQSVLASSSGEISLVLVGVGRFLNQKEALNLAR